MKNVSNNTLLSCCIRPWLEAGRKLIKTSLSLNTLEKRKRETGRCSYFRYNPVLVVGTPVNLEDFISHSVFSSSQKYHVKYVMNLHTDR